ncbi:endonuclease/exonuclease/phosphatase family protein [Salinibacterium sp. SYSU T00001]|uniref:endonuclease/exonuclease/phosphatase family protein n=1 Tax=Homoserinimonas sedimenticola TaxID=2986805 RepID=UPI002236AEE4|nr:endonuclease/exonuclease/phosphatase family protein [Salinibacterium sedimenticola]MCW4386512.1 endonuclease/exonuclease/phosphatase family protein [Salinibacterium sedimenticola]
MIRRLFAALLIVGSAALLLAAAWPQLFGLQRTTGIAHVVSLRGAAIAVALALIVALLVLALLWRRFRPMGASLAVLLVAFVLVSGLVLASRGVGPGDSIALTERSEGALTVLAWNTLGPATEPADVADVALDVAADVVVLPETRQEDAIDAAVLMREAGHPMWVLTSSYDLVSPARSTSMLVSVDLGEYRFDADERTTSVLPTLVATPVDGEGPTLIAVHAVAPVTGQMENWRSDLELLAELCSGDDIIMAGDFNATIDHFSGLGSWESTSREEDRLTSTARLGECTDAAAAAGAGAVGTWPTLVPGILGAPIDHVLATDEWRVDGVRVIGDRDDVGSDHRPIVAVLERALG